MTYLRLDDHIFDPDYELLQDILRTLDHGWDVTAEASKKYSGPDETAFIDRLEYIAGIGLTACQRYIVSTYPYSGNTKQDALLLPPLHPLGPSYVSLINSGANYWKHADEWELEPESRRKTTLALLNTVLKEEEMGFLCSNLLSVLVGDEPHPFSRLQELLLEWRSELIK